MKEMIDSYLTFAKGESEEKVENKNIDNFFNNLINKISNQKNIIVTTKIPKNIKFLLSP